MIEENRNKLQENMNEVRKAGEAAGLKINVGKTKTMVTGKENFKEQIELEDIKIENVTEFTNLGSLLTYENDCSKEKERRIGRATGVMAEFKKIWKRKNISIKTKRDIMVTCVIGVVLHACETWILKKKDKNKLMAFEMRCYRRILNVRWQQKIMNEEIRKRMGSKRNILQRIKEKKLNLFGHICRMEDSRLVKEVVFGEIKGKTKRGQPKKREWLDDVKEWCNEEIFMLKRKAQDGDAWKIIVKRALDTNG